ncbi:glycosyltransferase family 39 protein [Leptospira fletcheri]|uniref:Glycosyltransferase family 39 protein n=1 Tax=Leptospira fletcheri TaxID=2484981 RepID=A0A4R9GAI4_9LEPT|nr:glycosyltransferase family 39 protein [Leptospira fletcheri]TGK08732.1 glycosyltransferase family 39 protein [Leptospira fletcheri]
MEFLFRSVPFLTFLYFFLLLFGLGSFPLIDWDENIYGAASKSMYLSGDFFRISVNGQLFTEKPPLYFWLASFSYFCFGLNEFSTRFPSALSGLLAFVSVFWLGKKLKSSSFGLVWALVYSSSLLPLVLARTAYIDHLFNTFIFLGSAGLILYDQKSRKGEEQAWMYSAFASFCMALAVLAKGPLGLAIPVASFLAMRVAERRFRISFWHVTIGIVIFISGVSSYYLTDYLLHGREFLDGFLEFQKKLLTKSLESHTGPWFYHFIVALVGFFPWTPFLFAYLKRENLELLRKEELRSPAIFLLSWTVLVLLIFSIVKTKLPHYSSSFYFPLSFFAAVLLEERGKEFLDQKKGFFLAVGIFGAFLSLLFASLPLVAEYLISQGTFSESKVPTFSWTDALPGILLLLGLSTSVLSVFLLPSGKDLVRRFLLPVWLTLLLFLSSLSLTLVPKVLALLQDKNLRLFDRAIQEGGEVVFYKYLSFYPMFYRDQKIHIIGSYKFLDETEILTEPQEKKLFLIGNENSLTELTFLYPKKRFEPVAKDGGLILVRIWNAEKPR